MVEAGAPAQLLADPASEFTKLCALNAPPSPPLKSRRAQFESPELQTGRTIAGVRLQSGRDNLSEAFCRRSEVLEAGQIVSERVNLAPKHV